MYKLARQNKIKSIEKAFSCGFQIKGNNNN